MFKYPIEATVGRKICFPDADFLVRWCPEKMGDREYQLWTQKRGVLYTRVGGENCIPINDVGRLANVLTAKDNSLVVIAVANHVGAHLGLVALERILGSHRVQNFVVRNHHTPLSYVQHSLYHQFGNYMAAREPTIDSEAMFGPFMAFATQFPQCITGDWLTSGEIFALGRDVNLRTNSDPNITRYDINAGHFRNDFLLFRGITETPETPWPHTVPSARSSTELVSILSNVETRTLSMSSCLDLAATVFNVRDPAGLLVACMATLDTHTPTNEVENGSCCSYPVARSVLRTLAATAVERDIPFHSPGSNIWCKPVNSRQFHLSEAMCADDILSLIIRVRAHLPRDVVNFAFCAMQAMKAIHGIQNGGKERLARVRCLVGRHVVVGEDKLKRCGACFVSTWQFTDKFNTVCESCTADGLHLDTPTANHVRSFFRVPLQEKKPIPSIGSREERKLNVKYLYECSVCGDIFASPHLPVTPACCRACKASRCRILIGRPAASRLANYLSNAGIEAAEADERYSLACAINLVVNCIPDDEDTSVVTTTTDEDDDDEAPAVDPYIPPEMLERASCILERDRKYDMVSDQEKNTATIHDFKIVDAVEVLSMDQLKNLIFHQTGFILSVPPVVEPDESKEHQQQQNEKPHHRQNRAYHNSPQPNGSPRTASTILDYISEFTDQPPLQTDELDIQNCINRGNWLFRIPAIQYLASLGVEDIFWG